jgi:hypothetical protein
VACAVFAQLPSAQTNHRRWDLNQQDKPIKGRILGQVMLPIMGDAARAVK